MGDGRQVLWFGDRQAMVMVVSSRHQNLVGSRSSRLGRPEKLSIPSEGDFGAGGGLEGDTGSGGGSDGGVVGFVFCRGRVCLDQKLRVLARRWLGGYGVGTRASSTRCGRRVKGVRRRRGSDTLMRRFGRQGSLAHGDGVPTEPYVQLSTKSFSKR